jgi:hypothetical protein
MFPVSDRLSPKKTMLSMAVAPAGTHDIVTTSAAIRTARRFIRFMRLSPLFLLALCVIVF